MAVCDASKFHQIPEALWERIEPLLPRYKRSCNGGRPRLPMRNVVCGIFYVLRTGCQWKAMPAQFGSGSAIHDYFQEWVESRVFEKLWRVALQEYDDLRGIDWQWQSLDGATTKSPLGGEKNREKPDRSRQVGGEAFCVDRRPGRPDWRGRQRCQRARPDARERNVQQHSGSPSQADFSKAATSLCRQGV
jgi:transposase